MKTEGKFTANCFSDECGFCSSCCDSEFKSDDSEDIQRAQDLKKFMGNTKLDNEQDYYNKILKKYMKKYDYRNPNDKHPSNYSHEKFVDDVILKWDMFKNA